MLVKGGRWRWLLTATGLVAMSSSVWLFRDQVWAQNLREVEPGLVYRGAEQKLGPLRRIVRRYRIRTVLCLAEPEHEQQAVAESLGVQWLCVPLTSTSATLTFDRLERAAGIMADRAKQPVFFHCKRGVYRSHLAQAVYRMKYCGWTLDQAVNELRAIGYAPEAGGGDNCSAELLQRYYRERVLIGTTTVAN
ncbi:MAG: dual specificity protein phosphatase family protein [Planctomycetes bacterium]|nr:dual specificity protein phosphatase family protein [Planctomycetota bacterium]